MEAKPSLTIEGHPLLIRNTFKGIPYHRMKSLTNKEIPSHRRKPLTIEGNALRIKQNSS